jgi:HAD superfamily hydrolase (TIGR01458 family)
LDRLSDIRGFLIDLDGVVYTGGSAIPGAEGAVRFLRESGYSYRFVSNTTRKCRQTIAEQLFRMGLVIPESILFTPAIAAVAYLKSTGTHNYRLLVTGDVERDFPVKDRLTLPQGIDLIIVGDAGDEFTYVNLNAAFRDLINGAGLIALERDRFWMTPDGLSLSAGPFVTALESATGKTAVLMGKPSGAFFNLALTDMGLRPEQVVMIGDDIRTDVGGAQDAGMRGVIVKTGKYREELVNASGIRPDLTIDSIADIGKVVDAAERGPWERTP